MAAWSSPPFDVAMSSSEPVSRRARIVVAIAASTGGPRVLAELIPRLPGDLPAAVVVVQHMPRFFTAAFAERLDTMSDLPVREASAGALLQSGTVYLAPGGCHLSLARGPQGLSFRLEAGEPIWGVRPSADVFFCAAARYFGPACIGAVLTGMGRDGAAGLRAIREGGGWAVVQDEKSAVMPSMPRAAAPYAHVALPTGMIAAALSRRVARVVDQRRRP
jgi:two-component system, chemotaxis family, protein-glutamate methylesterase/glutaminase